MPISITVTGETAEAMIADLKRVFPALLVGGPVPPLEGSGDMLTQPKDGEVIPPADKKPPRKKKAEPETIEGKAEQIDLEEKIAEKAAEIPDIELVRAKLKALGATDGLGHDKVFEVLGKYGAKNASTIPEDKRQAVIDEVDALIAGVGK